MALINDNLLKKELENQYQYLWRLGLLVKQGKYRWSDITPTINKELDLEEDEYRGESAYRKPVQYATTFYEHVFSKMINDEYSKELEIQKREIAREKVKIRDERRAWSHQNYVASRYDEILELLETDMRNIGRINFPISQIIRSNNNNEAIVCLSDLHIGQTFDSEFGIYNSNVAKERLSIYLNQVIESCMLHKVKTIHVLSLGDQISGNIHKTVAITNKENVIEQIKMATELMSSFCYELSSKFDNVCFYNVSGNHSRLEKKDDALHDERLDDIISWGLQLTLSHIDNFKVMKEMNIDTGIVKLNVCDNTYIGVHGDYDSMSKQGVANICMLLGMFPYGMFRGHMHYPAMNEFNGIKVIQSGSMAGSGDNYTIEKRLIGNPSQTFCICNKKGIHCIYNVDLK